MRIDIDQVIVEQSDVVETCRFIFKTLFIAREFTMLNMFRPYRVLFICITLQMKMKRTPIGSKSDVDLLIYSAGEVGIFREM